MYNSQGAYSILILRLDDWSENSNRTDVEYTQIHLVIINIIINSSICISSISNNSNVVVVVCKFNK